MKPHRLRHIFLPIVLITLVALVAYWCASYWEETATTPPPSDPEAALTELRSGNIRFVNSRRTQTTDTRYDDAHRRRTAKGQHPFAATLSCSDSRVSPEFIFDQRAGSIFEVRNAGNVVDDDVLASFEYAVELLHVPLLVILGHKGCGAIEAVCEAGEQPLHDHLRALQTHMKGIHKQVIDCDHRHDAEVVDRVAAENARQQALGILRDSPLVKAAMERGETRLVYGLYDMETGAVEFFDIPAGPSDSATLTALRRGRTRAAFGLALLIAERRRRPRRTRPTDIRPQESFASGSEAWRVQRRADPLSQQP